MSEVHGKEELATVAAFLPWRGSLVPIPWALAKSSRNLSSGDRHSKKEVRRTCFSWLLKRLTGGLMEAWHGAQRVWDPDGLA